MNIRQSYEEREKLLLAPYAQLSSMSRGRKHDERECEFRPCFYRDLGRIIHSTAFRLLEYKTQVFVNHEGDYYRTRLTHSLEVAQMAVGLSRILRLNEDLAQTIALAHDLGHPPFGHSGEDALNRLMADEGGFEHNHQSFRVVTKLEERYPNFCGLNLSFEVLEGILKHTTEYDSPRANHCSCMDDFRKVGHPTLEAQIVNYADEIAYMNHDLDDGLHWGMLSVKSLKGVELWEETFKEVEREMPGSSERMKRIRTISAMINKLICDLQAETRKRIEDAGIKTIEDVRNKGKDIVSFSDDIGKKTKDVKQFLYEHVYCHSKVIEMAKRAEGIINSLFNAYLANPALLPEKYRLRLEADGSKRHICDYIAGMTDRFAIAAHNGIRAAGI